MRGLGAYTPCLLFLNLAGSLRPTLNFVQFIILPTEANKSVEWVPRFRLLGVISGYSFPIVLGPAPLKPLGQGPPPSH
jgi:hypothetical protein